MKPLVTIAITTLNRTRYLGETLACVLAQDYAKLDILVSDNGSSDETPLITQTLVKADPRVRLRRNDTTLPIHEHFNQCIGEARGEYFILLHDDDRINPRFVSEVVEVAMRHPDVHVVIPGNVMVDEQGESIREFAKPSCEVLDGATFVCHWLDSMDPPVLVDVTTMLMRTAVIRNFGGYQCFHGGRNIDNLLFLQCAIISRVGFARRAEFYWRHYSESYGSQATLNEIIDSGRAFLRHLRRDPETVRALAALPSASSKRVLRGVSRMTTYELLNQVQLKEHALRWRTVLALLVDGRKDVIFLLIVFREYFLHASPTTYYWLRGIMRGRLFLPQKRVAKEIEPSVFRGVSENDG